MEAGQPQQQQQQLLHQWWRSDGAETHQSSLATTRSTVITTRSTRAEAECAAGKLAASEWASGVPNAVIWAQTVVETHGLCSDSAAGAPACEAVLKPSGAGGGLSVPFVYIYVY